MRAARRATAAPPRTSRNVSCSPANHAPARSSAVRGIGAEHPVRSLDGGAHRIRQRRLRDQRANPGCGHVERGEIGGQRVEQIGDPVAEHVHVKTGADLAVLFDVAFTMLSSGFAAERFDSVRPEAPAAGA